MIVYNPKWYKLGFEPWCAFFVQTRPFWLFVLTTLICCIVVDWIGWWNCIPRIDRLPYTGWILEVVGVITVATGLANKIEAFGAERILDRFKSGFGALPFFRITKHVHASMTGVASATSSFLGEVRVQLPDASDPEARYRYVLDQVDALAGRLSQLESQTRSDINAAKQELREELGNVRIDIAEVGQKSKKAHVDEIGMELSGLMFVMLGLTFATIPGGVLTASSWLVSLLTIPASSCPVTV